MVNCMFNNPCVTASEVVGGLAIMVVAVLAIIFLFHFLFSDDHDHKDTQ
jgi:hypothetical protein